MRVQRTLLWKNTDGPRADQHTVQTLIPSATLLGVQPMRVLTPELEPRTVVLIQVEVNA